MPDFWQRRIDRVNSVLKFFEDPCQAPWSVYFKLALPPLGNAAVTILTFGLDDIFRGYFRPHGVYALKRTMRRRPRGRLARGLRQGIPELGEMVGRNLPGAERMAARGVSAGARALWLFDGVLQRYLFWWMLIDVLTDALYEWTTLIAETEFCKLDRLIGSAACRVQPSGYVREISGRLACSAREKLWGDITEFGGAIGYIWPIGVTAVGITAEPWVDDPWRELTGITVWIADADNPNVPLDEPTEGVKQPDGTYHAVVDAAVGHPRVTVGMVMAHGRNAWVSGGVISGWAYEE